MPTRTQQMQKLEIDGNAVVPSATLSTLPVDVISRIITFMPFGDVVSLSKVNSYFQNLLEPDNHLWRSRLTTELGFKLTPKEMKEPHLAMLQCYKTYRCVNC